MSSSHWLIIACIYFLWTCVHLTDSRPQDNSWSPVPTGQRSIKAPESLQHRYKSITHDSRNYVYPQSHFRAKTRPKNQAKPARKIIRSFAKNNLQIKDKLKVSGTKLKMWPDTHISSHEEMELYKNYTTNSIHANSVPIVIGSRRPQLPTPMNIYPTNVVYSINTQDQIPSPYPGMMNYPNPGTIRPPQHSVNIETAQPFEITPEIPVTPSSEKCPTVYITALELSKNATGFARQGCPDVKIVITHNSNDRNDAVIHDSSVPLSVQNDHQSPVTILTSARPATSKPTTAKPTTEKPSEDLQADESEPVLVTVLETLSSQSSWIDTLNPLLGLFLTPLSVIAAGGLSLLALLFPYSLPSFLTSRSSRKVPDHKVIYHPSQKHVNGWYWHDGYQTWSYKPAEEDEYDRRRHDDNSVRMYYNAYPYSYYGDRGKRRIRALIGNGNLKK